MAKNRKSQQTSSKGKKKKWHSILAPSLFNKKEIGKSYVYEAEDLLGKKIKMNLMTVTGEIKKQNMSMRFEITEVKDLQGHTSPIGFEINPTLIKRYVRRRRDRLDESLVYLTKDGKKVRIKPFVLTRNNVNGLQKKDIRRTIKLALQKIINSSNCIDIFGNLITYSLQKQLKEKVSKITPVRNAEIRSFTLEKETAKLSLMPDEIMKKANDDEVDKEETEKVEETNSLETEKTESSTETNTSETKVLKEE